MPDLREPQGVIAIMTAPDGDVIATATDFNRSGMGGCTLWEAQKWRTRDAVQWQAVRAYCSDVVFQALDSFTVDRISRCLLDKGKHQISYRTVGYGDDVAAEIKRQ